MATVQKQRENLQVGKVISLLDLWWGEKFKKVPASGALRWGDGNQYWIYADLVPPVSFPFCIECKNHSEFDLDEAIRKDLDNGKLTYYWYHQTVGDALRAGRELGQVFYPMMIYRVHKKSKDRMVIQENLWERVPKDIKNTLAFVTFNIPYASPFVVTPLAEFLTAVPRPLFESALLGRTCSTSQSVQRQT